MAGVTMMKSLGIFLLILTTLTPGASSKTDATYEVASCSAMEAAKCAGLAVAAGGTVAWLGFGTGGVAAGSVAAWAQSYFYGGKVAPGSIFAILQSIGAKGVGTGTGTSCLTAIAKCFF